MFAWTCLGCGRDFQIDERMRGQDIRCPACDMAETLADELPSGEEEYDVELLPENESLITPGITVAAAAEPNPFVGLGDSRPTYGRAAGWGGFDFDALPPAQRAPVGSRNWTRWILPPKNRASQLLLGYLVTTVGVVIFLIVMMWYTSEKNARDGQNPGACVWGIMGLIATVLHSVYRYGRQVRAPDASAALDGERREPVLLLRSFGDDGLTLEGFQEDRSGWVNIPGTETKSFEEYLAEVLGRRGPVIACGQPGTRVAPLGAARFWVAHEHWQNVVEELLTEAQCIVMVMGRLRGVDPSADPTSLPPLEKMAGLTWEARRLFLLPDRRRVVLLMPPVDEEEAKVRWKQYRVVSGGLLPPYSGGEIAIGFNADGNCGVTRTPRSGLLVKGYHRNLPAYNDALRVRS